MNSDGRAGHRNEYENYACHQEQCCMDWGPDGLGARPLVGFSGQRAYWPQLRSEPGGPKVS